MRWILLGFSGLLILAGGCGVPKAAEKPAATSRISEDYPPDKLRVLAEKNLLDIQTLESLRLLGAEPGEHQLRLRFSELLPEVMAIGYEPKIEIDPRLDALEKAIGFAYLTSRPGNSDLMSLHRVRVRQHIGCSVMILLCKLAAQQEIASIYPSDSGECREARRRVSDLTLELRSMTGLSAEAAKHLRGPLVRVEPFVVPLQQWAAMVIKERSESADTKIDDAFLFLLRRKFPDHGAQLKLSLELLKTPSPEMIDGAIFMQLELDMHHLGNAFDAWRLAKLKHELNPNDKAVHASLIRAVRNWRIAYYLFMRDSARIDFAVPVIS